MHVHGVMTSLAGHLPAKTISKVNKNSKISFILIRTC